MLTVAVDATPIFGRRTGIGVVVTALMAEMARRSTVSIRGYGLTLRGWGGLADQLPAGVDRARAPMPAGALTRVWALADHPVAEWWTGPVDVVHGTNFVVPPTRRARRIVSVYDMTPWRFPEMCAPAMLRYPKLVERAVSGGAWVHTGARVIADEIVEILGVAPERVRVVPLGVTTLEPGPDTGIERPYILGMGTTEPRKDFVGLVAAFGQIAARYPDLDLRIAGPAGWAEHDLKTAIAGSPWRERVHRMGWVDDRAALIGGASVFAYSSVYEGFGLPPLEAMSVGVPVVATAAGAVPEVVGDAAIVVAPSDPEALAAGLHTVLADEAVRNRLITAGRARVVEFGWVPIGDAMEALYREVAAS